MRLLQFDAHVPVVQIERRVCLRAVAAAARLAFRCLASSWAGKEAVSTKARRPLSYSSKRILVLPQSPLMRSGQWGNRAGGLSQNRVLCVGNLDEEALAEWAKIPLLQSTWLTRSTVSQDCQTGSSACGMASRRLEQLSRHVCGAPAQNAQLLAGIRVVELSTMAAAPAAAAVLADLGAEVIKIESPSGDPWRTTGVKYRPGVEYGVMFEHDNRGKQSVVLDLKQGAGMKAFKQLLGGADVLLTNVRKRGLLGLGLDYESVAAEFPQLIYCHLSAWGRSGPKENNPGYDTGAYASASGIMEFFRPSDTAKLSRWPVGLGDHSTAMNLVGGIALALFHRTRTGVGQLVDVSLLRSGIWANALSLVAAETSKSWSNELRQEMHMGGRPLLLQVKLNHLVRSSFPPYSRCSVAAVRVQGGQVYPPARLRNTSSSPWCVAEPGD
jgi:hypothetical protein